MDSVTSTAPEPENLAALHAQDAAHLRALFLELADLGAGIVRVIAQAVNDQAYAPALNPSHLQALAAAHDQTMRSLRRTALLIQKLTAPAPAKDTTAQSRDAARAPSVRPSSEKLDLSKLSDAELDRLDALEGMERLESCDELAQRPLVEIIATILSDFGVTGLNDGDGAPQLAPADIAALYEYATGLAVSRQAPSQGGLPASGAAADAMHRNGATGCRDP
jgi:hypothetical protein